MKKTGSVRATHLGRHGIYANISDEDFFELQWRLKKQRLSMSQFYGDVSQRYLAAQRQQDARKQQEAPTPAPEQENPS